MSAAHPHHPILFAIAVGIFILGFCSTIVNFGEFGRNIRRAMVDTINVHRKSHKEVYLSMGYTKGEWSRILSGEAHVSLDRLAGAPDWFKWGFLPAYMALLARDFMEQVREDVIIERPVRRENEHVDA